MVGMDAAVVLAALASTLPPPGPAEPARPKVPDGPARTVGEAVRRAHLTGAISWTGRAEYEQQLKTAKAAARRLPPMRAREIRGSLRVARRLAAQGRLGPERLTAVMASIRATTEVMRHRPFPMPAERTTLPMDGLVYEFRPGAGVHPHPLATAGRLNGLTGACLHDRREASCRPAALSRTADDLGVLGVRDGARLRFEYTFPFARGRPPWSSSMAQATSAQALARAARVTGERRHAIAASQAYRALVSPSTSVRAGGRVARFSMYSFQPSMRVLNGELQTLVGLADYARIAGSRRARRVARRTARRMVRSLDAWDTGAWTLYSAGGREASLHYHRLAATFAARACALRLARGFCPAAKRYARYTREPPRLSIRVDRTVTAPRRVRVRVRSSKLAHGALVVRGPKGYRVRRALTLTRRGTTVRFPVRRSGRFRLVLSGTAVNDRRDVARALVRAKPDPAIKRRREARRRAAERRRRAARRRAARERRERAERAQVVPDDRPPA
jgi:hypothetical protein